MCYSYEKIFFLFKFYYDNTTIVFIFFNFFIFFIFSIDYLIGLVAKTILKCSRLAMSRTLITSL